MDLVEFLRQNYVDQNEIDLLGFTVLDYANRGGYKEIIKILSSKEPESANQKNKSNGRIFSN